MSADVKSALKHRVVMLSGDEEVLRRRALADLLEAADPMKDGFDLQTLVGDASQPVEWFGSASTSPFLAPRRTVVVRHALRASVEGAAGVDFSKLPESALLILVADEEPAGDRSDRARSSRTAWEKLVTKAGGSVLTFNADPKKTRERLRAEVESLGRKMSSGAEEALVEMTGGSLSRASDELQKLLVYVPEGPIRETDVLAVVVPSREWNVFKMVDAIVAGNVPEALGQLRSMVGSSQKAEEAAYRYILPQVGRQLRLLWQARLCVDAGCSPASPTEKVARMLPAKPNLVQEAPYRHARLVQAARRTSLRQLTRCLAILADTDARLKGLLSSFSAIETLERMLLEMAEALAPAAR